jgi:PKD repeat protein
MKMIAGIPITALVIIFFFVSLSGCIASPEQPMNCPPLQKGAEGIPQQFNYTLRGQTDTISIPVYSDAFLHYSCIANTTRGNYSAIYKNYIDDPELKQYLEPLVSDIKTRSSDPDDQARIAISLVQQIPYDLDAADALEKANYQSTIPHPYETLYHNKGICEDKAILLACLLKELGYGAAILRYEQEHHAAVGLSVPEQYSQYDSTYAFVETTSPSIITFTNATYGRTNFTIESYPEIIPVSQGKQFTSISEEYNDAKDFDYKFISCMERPYVYFPGYFTLAYYVGPSSGRSESCRNVDLLMYKYGMTKAKSIDLPWGQESRLVAGFIFHQASSTAPAPVRFFDNSDHEILNHGVVIAESGSCIGCKHGPKIIHWDWDFGDGETSTEENPIHTYHKPGMYSVTLTATDEKGESDSVTKQNIITVI